MLRQRQQRVKEADLDLVCTLTGRIGVDAFGLWEWIFLLEEYGQKSGTLFSNDFQGDVLAPMMGECRDQLAR